MAFGEYSITWLAIYCCPFGNKSNLRPSVAGQTGCNNLEDVVALVTGRGQERDEVVEFANGSRPSVHQKQRQHLLGLLAFHLAWLGMNKMNF